MNIKPLRQFGQGIVALQAAIATLAFNSGE